MKPRAPEPSPASLRWLSRDYSALRSEWQREVKDDTWKPFDVLIVGSGYGGAMAAAELAGKQVIENGEPRTIRVCVLERGREYAPGMFASSLQELPPHVRVHRSTHDKTLGPLDALLDVRIGPDVCALVGNGLGGTSLINAGVMIAPRLDDCDRLPAVLRKELTPALFAQVQHELGASTGLPRHPDVPPGGLPKTRALHKLAASAGVDGDGKHVDFVTAPITVQLAANKDDPAVPPCTLCGDCMTGCNVGAKKSLDTTLLREAWHKRAEIYTGGSVLKVRKNGDQGIDGRRDARWTVSTVYTDESMRRRHAALEIHAHRVILAAGTLGSTEILLRSRSWSLSLSNKLGEQFSCNGDNLVALHDGPDDARPTADEFQPLRNRGVGPTITSMIDLKGLLVQEFAVPAPLKRLFEEMVTTARLLNDLGKPPTLSGGGGNGCDSFGVDTDAMKKTLLVGLIGHDESCGQLQLADAKSLDDSRHLEGRLRISWPKLRDSYMLGRGYDIVKGLVEKARPDGKAHYLPNPMWRLLPQDMEFLVKGERGPVLTVHPLGGCPMGESHRHGVVDDHGRVFDWKASEAADRPCFHDGLVVLDGSIIPASLGANPALMIATVAKRAAGLLAAEWGLVAANPAPRNLRTRPVFRKPEQCTPGQPRDTEVELAERLVGCAGKYMVELTMRYQPVVVTKLARADRPKLTIDSSRSFVRIYKGDAATRRRLITWSEPKRDDEALLVARVEGTLNMLRQEPGEHGLRKWWAAWNWFLNRGTREFWDGYIARTTSQNLNPKQFLASATRAAEARLFDYIVTVQEIKKIDPSFNGLFAPGVKLHGEKRLTYGRCSNPWQQLTQMRLTTYPPVLGPGVLKLDGRFLAKQGFPLIRITRQENQMVALAELASWGACWARMLLSIHLWSFRAPDVAPRVRRPQLLPADAPKRLPAPAITELELEPPRKGIPVRLRLTRYPGPRATPVVLIHGYSASGSTFTHDALPMPLALYLNKRGHDVWVLDLRTSAGMPSAVLPWHFEDAALADIPLAIAHIRRATGAAEVNVFAHCIGAVMLGMALLTDASDLWKFDLVDPADDGPRAKRYCEELRVLRQSVGRIVLSQKAPALVYSDENVLRAYFMRVLRRAILPDDYRFTVPTEQHGVAGGLMDRLLATVPYPPDEFRRENPFWPPWKRAPWAGFRHRMDALYARDFSLGNVTDKTLASIQDLFGPLNLDTVSQGIHFARSNTITDASGRAIDAQGATLAARWPRKGTLSIHGADNGLANVATLDVFQAHMQRAGVHVDTLCFDGYGHQDCLIGRHAGRDVFPGVARFLEHPHGRP